MMDRQLHEGTTPSKPEFESTQNPSSPSFLLRDDEIEIALARLQTTVAGEKVHDKWMLPETSSNHVLESCDNEHAAIKSDSGSDSFSMNQHSESREKQPPRSSTERAVSSRTRKKWTRVISGAASAAVLIGLFASPLGSKAIASAMQTLYFQNVVGVGQDDLSQIESALSSETNGGTEKIDLKKYGSVEVSGRSNQRQSLTLADASKRLGLSVKALPGFDAKSDKVNFDDAQDITFRLKVDAINGLISRLGGKTSLPKGVDGEPIVVHIPGRISENIGIDGKSMNLDELQIPTIQAPSDVDLNQVRQALLDLPFLPSDIRQSLSSSENWKNTLYVPTNGQAINLTVNGYPAVLQSSGQGQNRYSSILWLENGVLFELSGSSQTFPTDNSLIEQAKELTH